MASLRTDYDDVDYEESKNHEHSDSNRFTATDFAAARDALRLKSQAVMLSEPTSPSPNHPPNVPSNPGATTGNNVDSLVIISWNNFPIIGCSGRRGVD